MTSEEKYTFVQKNRDTMSRDTMAVALSMSESTVQYFLYRYEPKQPKIKHERIYVYRPLKEVSTDFETNGFFDVDKWAVCLHV